MTGWPSNPVVYEVNTWPWLSDLRRCLGSEVTLADLPTRAWDELAGAVRMHLAAGDDYQRGLIRFIENHDEPRAAAAFPGGRERAAAVAIATLPGATLWHDGQIPGRRVRLPVFLGRRPDEPADPELVCFYQRLIAVASRLRRGAWSLADVRGWPDNPTHDRVLAWVWRNDRPHVVVAVNLSGQAAQGRIALPWDALRGGQWRLTDVLTNRIFHRDGDELAGPGLYVDLPPWGAHVFELEPR
jgi:hypothetical protein